MFIGPLSCWGFNYRMYFVWIIFLHNGDFVIENMSYFGVFGVLFMCGFLELRFNEMVIYIG